MKNLKTLGIIAIFILMVFIGCKKDETVVLLSLPSEVTPSCTVTSQEFNTWFDSGKASENGSVKSANSVDLIHNNNCDFYKWSEQMFLWITSQQSDGQTTMESPLFYTVTPKDSIGHRTLIPHKKGQLMMAMSNISKSDTDSEEGQATDDVLMAKDGSLIYYISMVNDVYAQFLTAVNQKKMDGSQFPTTTAQRDSIVAFAKSNGVTLTDADVLTMEMKTSWIDASTISDVSDYVTINAIVPTYTKTDSIWKPIGQRTAKLALIGVHIVGSVSGHPEMVWATFEHKNNAPNLSYTYLDTNNKTVTVSADTGSNWLLSSNAADPNPNISHMIFDTITGNIVNKNSYTISPSNTTRTKPWGVAADMVPNAENTSVAAANSEIISINNSVQSLLVGNDVRKNYLFLGATWTQNGAAPTGRSYSTTNTSPGVAIGASQLANSTMETYAQNGANFIIYGSCFGCHSNYNSATLSPTYISHVFSGIQPLPNGFMNKK